MLTNDRYDIAGWAAAGLAVLSLALPAGAQTTVDTDLGVETVLTGLDQPTTMAFLGPDEFLFLEKTTGRVRYVKDGVLETAFALDVDVATSSERGLLGIAINTESPPGVFLFYTESASQGGSPIANRVYRYDWNSSTEVLENGSLVLDLPVFSGPNHDGGILVLGEPDAGTPVGDGAQLYAVIGDLNRNNQLENFPSGADPDDTAVVLRVLQDGTPAPGNPFTPYCSTTTTTTCSDDGDCPGAESCITEVASYWAYGVRNSFGLALDPSTGDLWDTENGPGSYDEINRLPDGANSGWERIMGPDSRDPQDIGDLFDIPGAGSTYHDPEFSWLATIAPTAIVFPIGSSLGSAYDGTVLAADYNLGQVYAFPLNGARSDLDLAGFSGVSDRVADSVSERNQFLFGSGFGGTFSGVTDLKIGPDGDLWIVSTGGFGAGNGAIWRVSGPSPQPLPVPALGGVALAVLVFALAVSARARTL